MFYMIQKHLNLHRKKKSGIKRTVEQSENKYLKLYAEFENFSAATVRCRTEQ